MLIVVAGWRSIFFINLLLGGRHLAHTPVRSRDAACPDHGLDLPGQAAAMTALATLADATIEEIYGVRCAACDRRLRRRVTVGAAFVVGTRRIIACGALLMGVGCLAMFGLLSAHAAALVAALVASLVVTGFGIGLIAVPLTSALRSSVGPSWSGIASGTLMAFRQTGSVPDVTLSARCKAAWEALPACVPHARSPLGSSSR